MSCCNIFKNEGESERLFLLIVYGPTFNCVQGRCSTAVAVALDPVNFDAPLGPCGRAVAVITFHKTARRVCECRRYRVDVCVHPDVDVRKVKVEIHRAAKQVKAGFGGGCTAAHIGPTSIFKLVDGAWHKVSNRQVVCGWAILDGLFEVCVRACVGHACGRGCGTNVTGGTCNTTRGWVGWVKLRSRTKSHVVSLKFSSTKNV